MVPEARRVGNGNRVSLVDGAERVLVREILVTVHGVLDDTEARSREQEAVIPSCDVGVTCSENGSLVVGDLLPFACRCTLAECSSGRRGPVPLVSGLLTEPLQSDVVGL